VAVNTIETLVACGYKVHREAIYEGLRLVSWKGRMEVMNMKPWVLLDGAHNIDGIDKLNRGIDTYFKYNKLYLIIGILTDKQVDDMLRIITPKAEKVIAVTPNTERAEQAEALRERVLCFNSRCEAFENYEEAFIHALSLCDDNDLLVVCGSLYMIGDMRKILKKLL
jgi:dihydrofolate synthase/folylpolyglutamate synthase